MVMEGLIYRLQQIAKLPQRFLHLQCPLLRLYDDGDVYVKHMMILHQGSIGMMGS